MADDLYRILGVKRDASEKDIRTAYRKLARRYHPDVNPGDESAQERFKRINEAYQVLSDDKARKDYDEFGDNWRHADQIRNAGGQVRFGRGRGSRFDWEDLGDPGAGGFRSFGGFTDLFDFAAAAGGPRGQAEVREVGVEVSLAEAYRGTTRIISTQGAEPCSSCGGSGRRGSTACAVCRGVGLESRQRKLEVKIPAGIDDGHRVRVRPAEGVELSLHVTVRPDP